MTLEELRERDYWGAFDEWISVKEAKATGNIPEDYHYLLRDYCECGSERMIKKNNKSWTCVDPKCPIKMAKSMVEIFNRFGIKEIGYKSCLKIINKFFNNDDYDHNSIFGIFENAELKEWEFGESLKDKYETALIRIRSERLTLTELISLIALPEIKGKASMLVGDFKSLQDIITIIGTDGVNRYYDIIGLHNNSIKFYFNYFLVDMMKAHDFCRQNMITTTSSVLNIVITGNINFNGEPIKKDNYVKMLNDLLTVEGHRIFTIKNGKALKSAEAFIMEPDTSSSSAMEARQREKIEGKKLIYTPDEFAMIIYGLSQKAKDEIGEGVE